MIFRPVPRLLNVRYMVGLIRVPSGMKSYSPPKDK